MTTIIITVEGVEALAGKAGRVVPVVSAALLAGGVHVKGKIATYPAQAHLTRKEVYGSSFVSDRQRRWFFAIGINQTPYSRTSQLGQSWAVAQPQPLQVIVGNATPYGPFVQGAGSQTLYHKRQMWKNTDDIANSEASAVANLVKQALDVL